MDVVTENATRRFDAETDPGSTVVPCRFDRLKAPNLSWGSPPGVPC